VNAGIVYDAFGRTTTQGSGATIAYYTNDLVQQQTSGTSRQTWTLDAAQRLAAWTTETNDAGTWTQTGSKVNHYGSNGDSPDWIQEDTAGTITRNVQGPSGDLDATASAAGGTVLDLTDIHGDLSVQLPLDITMPVVAFAYDEFGGPESGTTATRYGWLGSMQRSGETPTGAILMGVRVYDQALGRFLSVDPVPGGSSNAYEYASQSPVSFADPAGTYKVSWGWTQLHVTLSRKQNTGLHSGAGWAAAAIGGIKKLGPYGRAAYYAFPCPVGGSGRAGRSCG
jgi:RHS repeat-associated protein